MKVARRTGLCSIIGVAALAVLALTPQLASATPTAAAASPGWPALQQQAAHAVAGSIAGCRIAVAQPGHRIPCRAI